MLKLRDLAASHVIGRIFIYHNDRLTRFGLDYLVWHFRLCGVEVISLEEDEKKTPQQELVDDLMALLASFSGKFYGIRKKDKEKLRKRIDQIETDQDSKK